MREKRSKFVSGDSVPVSFKMIFQKVMAAGTRNVHFSTKKAITFFLEEIQSSSLNCFLSISV